MLKKFKKGDEKGFTLVELLVVIAIVAILAVVVLVAINPLEMIRKSRNTRRLSDMESLKKAIDLAILDATVSGTSTPFAANASNNSCNVSPTRQSSTGNGWIPYDPLVMNLQKHVPALPLDPQNATTQCYYFFAAADGIAYELNVPLENVADAIGTMSTDGGDDVDRYEVGTNIQL